MQQPRQTRIQRANARKILDAALDVFSAYGFNGATIDKIAQSAGMSKPNLLYYYASKEDIYRAVLDTTLDMWLDPLRQISSDGNALDEIRTYIRTKLEMARDYPRESRLFANEMLHGARLVPQEMADTAALIAEKSKVIQDWIDKGAMAAIDPRHMFFAIWATTQHYADFEPQVQAVLGQDHLQWFDDAVQSLETLFFGGLRPR